MTDQRLTDLPPVIREALAVHEAFRRLGVASADIYFVQYRDQPFVSIEARQGDKRFPVAVGDAFDGIEDVWSAATRAWNAAPTSEQMAVFEASAVYNNTSRFMSALIDHGFIVRGTAR